jgi:lambda repressor-like predicted transcriptional regulator
MTTPALGQRNGYIGAGTFPTAPIRQILQRRATDLGLSLTDLADIIRLPRRTLTRLLSRSHIRWDTADRTAIALGHHPSEIWPNWYPENRSKTQAPP